MFKEIFLNFLVLNCFLRARGTRSIAKAKMYYFEQNRIITWPEADSACKKFGMNLATIRTDEEFQYLKEFLKKEYGKNKIN